MFGLFGNTHLPTASPEETRDAVKADGAGAIIIDVREPSELQEYGISGAINIPLGSLEEKVETLRQYKKVFVICRSGGRSSQAVNILHKKGITQAINVQGGVMEWRKKVV